MKMYARSGNCFAFEGASECDVWWRASCCEHVTNSLDIPTCTRNPVWDWVKVYRKLRDICLISAKMLKQKPEEPITHAMTFDFESARLSRPRTESGLRQRFWLFVHEFLRFTTHHTLTPLRQQTCFCSCCAFFMLVLISRCRNCQ